jgi:hypothetical protein
MVICALYVTSLVLVLVVLGLGLLVLVFTGTFPDWVVPFLTLSEAIALTGLILSVINFIKND